MNNMFGIVAELCQRIRRAIERRKPKGYHVERNARVHGTSHNLYNYKPILILVKDAGGNFNLSISPIP
jgi:hypothetical protein